MHYTVFIARAQFPHHGHFNIIREALSKSDKLILAVGSSKRPPSMRNPFSFLERAEMITAGLTEAERSRVVITPLLDYVYSKNTWLSSTQLTVSGVQALHSDNRRNDEVSLIGHSKDHSSYYLKQFPQWNAINVPNYNGLNSTPLRYKYIRNGELPSAEVTSGKVVQWLAAFKQTDKYKYLNDYLLDLENKSYHLVYTKSMKATPWKYSAYTADSIVTQSGFVLLINRKQNPGKGLLALPGGFVNSEETAEEASIRELREETRLRVPTPVLLGSLRKSRVFDDPFRDDRGRIITNAFHYALEDNVELPRVRSGSDAARAGWYAISELDSELMFGDHYDIIHQMIAGE